MKNLKKGFTILELLFVILIIIVLISVLVVAVGGGTNTARSAKCLSNLRNVASAAVSHAMSSGEFPLAGSIEWYEGVYTGSDIIYNYYEHVGWIAWDSNGAYSGTPHKHTSNIGWFTSTYEQNLHKRKRILQRGTLFGYLNNNREMYLCPEHAKVARKMTKKKLPPNWSYAMNSWFGWDSSRGEKARHGNYNGRDFESVTKADKRLLFAELYWTEIPGCSKPNFSLSSGTENDCTLDYGEEFMGFNHVNGSDKVAHVVFADTHVEVIRLPDSNVNDSELRKITRLLCEGRDWGIVKGRFEEL
jgi:type II secretory pathway pseudopilin PulG